MEIPLGATLTAFMKFLGIDLDQVGEHLRRSQPVVTDWKKRVAGLKKQWRRWETGDTYPERASVPLIFQGLGFYRVEDFKERWEEFKATPEGLLAIREEEKELNRQLRPPHLSEIAEKHPPYDASWAKRRRRVVKRLVEERFAARRLEIPAGKAQAADSLWPQLLRNAEIVDDQIEIFDVLCEE